jgi:hypothetical protein
LRISKTFDRQLVELLDQGAERFSEAIIDEKRRLVYDTLRNTILPFPGLKRADGTLGLVVYPITKTPFVVLYDFNDAEVRVHLILHRKADIDLTDRASIEW